MSLSSTNFRVATSKGLHRLKMIDFLNINVSLAQSSGTDITILKILSQKKIAKNWRLTQNKANLCIFFIITWRNLRETPIF
jgi:hypothetical protein